MIRTRRAGDTWQLQTAVIHLRHSTTGRRLTLLSMIHIGLPDYYERLGDIIAEYEVDGRLVLFEGVGELPPEEAEALPEEEHQVYRSLASLNAAYQRIAASLRLVAQPDAMPKPKPGWIRADLPVRDLLRRWVKGRLPLIPAMEQAGGMLESAFMRRAVRIALLQEPLLLGAVGLLRGRLTGLGGMTHLLIDERNTAALAAFDSADGTRDAVMMYGAGHIPGLLAGFERRGFREAGREWYTAHEERIPYTDFFDRLAGKRGSRQ